MGIQYCAGILTLHLNTQFPGYSQFSLNGVTAVAIGVLMVAMGPAGKAQARMGQRGIVGFGGIMMATGLLGCAYCKELWHVYVSYSILCSYGMGFAYLGAVTSCSLWFTPEKRPLAVAIASSGSGLGTILLGLVTVDVYANAGDNGWRDTFSVLAVIACLGTLISACFFVPPVEQNATPTTLSAREVLQTPDLCYFMFVLVVFGLGSWNVIVLFPKLAAGVKNAEYAIEIGFGIGSVLGRPVAAEILQRTGRRQGFPGILLLLALMACLAPVMSKNTIMLGINNFFYGWGFGAFIATLPPITAEIVGAAKLPVALGLVYASPGISFMVGPPLCGMLDDVDIAFYASGAAMAISALMMMKLARAAMVASS